MLTYYIALGSNVGNSVLYLNKAVSALQNLGNIKKKSSIYTTSPVGEKEQDDFFNAVIEFEFNESPVVLLEKIKNLEKELGRKQSLRWGPREIDIDIIDYIGPKVEKRDLVVPHKELENRKFVLIPLSEINPGYRSREGKSISNLISDIENGGRVELLNKDW